ncbi:M15 family metallopeptidase [Dethiosulfatarculus sandiegensis]|uniref:M15 family metallopeptidase n=1 Tax=Dethiosulfatarculus sandiegensis TaxID=1429043 RepID=UPI000B0616D6|nr:M15 family metallopeptidase [Dethiosulfatarculus sandiegensis]
MDYLEQDPCLTSIKPMPSLKPGEVAQHPIRENGEKLVPASLIPEKILARPEYFLQGLAHSLPECLVREGVLKRLIKAANLLPKGFKLVLLDTYRPVELQKLLFDKYLEEIRQKRPGAGHEELMKLTQRFVALPRSDKGSPSPHLTGGAVDLTICDDQGMVLEMGAGFDETTFRSFTRYLEEKLENKDPLSPDQETALKNRRLLYHVMTAAGFTNLPNEWWHFNYGNQPWACRVSAKGFAPAVYGPARPDFRWA